LRRLVLDDDGVAQLVVIDIGQSREGRRERQEPLPVARTFRSVDQHAVLWQVIDDEFHTITPQQVNSAPTALAFNRR